MPWITSLGRRPCNDCRTVAPTGESVYLGTTGMIWCHGCATTHLHVTPETDAPPVSGVRFPESWERFKPSPPPSWHERDE